MQSIKLRFSNRNTRLDVDIICILGWLEKKIYCTHVMFKLSTGVVSGLLTPIGCLNFQQRN